MKVGASQYHPGLTVRWWTYRHDTCSLDSLTPALGAYAMRGTVDGVERRWMLYTVDDNADPVECGEYTRRCDAKRAAEVLVGQWWREKCEREAASRDAMLGVVIRGMARMTAVTESANVATAKGDDLDRLAEVYGVERREPAAPVQYTFRAEGVEKVTAAFRALADAAKKAGESVRATAGVMPRLNRSPDTDIVVAVRDE